MPIRHQVAKEHYKIFVKLSVLEPQGDDEFQSPLSFGEGI